MATRSFCVPVEGHEYVYGQDPNGQPLGQPLSHPIDGPMRSYGAFWTDDAFTFSLLVPTCNCGRYPGMHAVLKRTGEVEENKPAPGPDTMVQHRRVNTARKKMRIMESPLSKR